MGFESSEHTKAESAMIGCGVVEGASVVEREVGRAVINRAAQPSCQSSKSHGNICRLG